MENDIIIMEVIYGYLELGNWKILKFYMKSCSYMETNPALQQVLHFQTVNYYSKYGKRKKKMINWGGSISFHWRKKRF